MCEGGGGGGGGVCVCGEVGGGVLYLAVRIVNG